VPGFLEVVGVTLEYRSPGRAPSPAVEDVTFDVRRGEKFIVIGVSGCGKTTLLKSIGGFLTPSRGRILLEGRQITAPAPERAMVFQDFEQLFPWYTAVGNIRYALKVTGKASGQRAADLAMHYLSLVGMANAATKYPHQLSGGMKQRVAIARALALEPKVLLMDEPFAALDAITRTALQHELNEIWRKTGITIILVTHSIQEAVYLGHRVLLMSPGPGRVQGIIDVSHVEDMDSREFAECATRLRTLLVPSATAHAASPGAVSV
jgi:NitT/TauT family transport system ATP-binding protein